MVCKWYYISYFRRDNGIFVLLSVEFKYEIWDDKKSKWNALFFFVCYFFLFSPPEKSGSELVLTSSGFSPLPVAVAEIEPCSPYQI
jgi:hypothetical protein